MQEPTLLRLNRKSPEPSDCKLALWPLTACDQQLSAETRSSEAPLQQPSTNNVPVPEPEPSSLKSLTVQPEQSGDGCCVTDGNCHKLVILVVFDSASRLVWGRSQQSLHDVLHWALLHKQMLFVLPVEGHKAGYASDAMETHLATANAILLQQA